MNNYVLLTESGSDLTPEVAQEYGIKIVPMVLQLDGKTYADGTLSPEDLFNYCDEHNVFPTTSAPSPADFERIYNEIRSENPNSIIIHLGYSAQTTSSYQNAIIADEEFENIHHIDSEQVSIGLGAVAVRTAKYLQANPDVTPEEALIEIRKICDKMQFHFLVPDMRYLKAGGRTSNAQYLLAQMLSIKPLIEMEKGLLVATQRLRGKMQSASEKMIDRFFTTLDVDMDEIYLGFSHRAPQELRDHIEEKCRRDYNAQNIKWRTAGCIISTHGGPGCLAIAAFVK